MYFAVSDMGFRLPNLRQMQQQMGCNIFIMSYRGYGESEGEPSESGLKMDAQCALDYVFDNAERLGIDERKVFIFGRSLGGAVAIYMASKHSERIGGLIIENTFTCIADMVKQVLPFLDFDVVKQYMLKLEWRSVDLIPHIKCPMLFFASTEVCLSTLWILVFRVKYQNSRVTYVYCQKASE